MWFVSLKVLEATSCVAGVKTKRPTRNSVCIRDTPVKVCGICLRRREILGTALILVWRKWCTIPRWFSRLLYGIAFSSLTSSFCLIHLAFLEVTKIKLGPKKLQSARFVGGVIISHFALAIMAAVAGGLKPSLAPSQIFCQAFFVIWGSLLLVSFIYSGLKLIHRDGNVPKQLEAIEIGQSTSRTNGRRGRERTSKVAKIKIATSILGTFLLLWTSALFNVRRL